MAGTPVAKVSLEGGWNHDLSWRQPMEKIRVGVSTCLLGEAVRYDGGHAHDRYVTQTLGRYMEFVPVCPETEAGLGIPPANP